MFKNVKLILFCIIIPALPALGFENNINKNEYPSFEKVEPVIENKSDLIISGSVEKNIEINLDNCIKIALGNNPRISAALNDILAADSRVKQVWANFFPSISWQTSYTYLKQLQLSDALSTNLQFNYYLAGQATLQQMLYDFGVTQNQATIRKLSYEEYKKTFESVVNDVIYQTKDAYFNLLLAFENKRIASDTVENYQMFYNQAKAFYKSGMNPKVDITIAETNLSNAKLKYIQAENSVNLAMARLNNIMGVPYMEKYGVKDRLKYKPVYITFVQAIDIARESRPELHLAELKVEEANQTVKLAKKSFYPSLSFETQFQKGGKSWWSNDGYNIGGYLIFPTINIMLIRNEIKEAKYLYDKELANAKDTQNSIYLEIQNSYLTLDEKRNQLPYAILQIKQAKENYELSFGRYKVGEATPTELKDSEATYEQAQLTYYNALYEYNSAKAQLEKAIGRNLCGDCNCVELKNN